MLYSIIITISIKNGNCLRQKFAFLYSNILNFFCRPFIFARPLVGSFTSDKKPKYEVVKREQCDQMAILLFQYLAALNNINLPISICQSRFTILPNNKYLLKKRPKN